jgi:hypothetical protein
MVLCISAIVLVVLGMAKSFLGISWIYPDKISQVCMLIGYFFLGFGIRGMMLGELGNFDPRYIKAHKRDFTGLTLYFLGSWVVYVAAILFYVVGNNSVGSILYGAALLSSVIFAVVCVLFSTSKGEKIEWIGIPIIIFFTS